MNSNSCEIFPPPRLLSIHPSEHDDSHLVVDDFASEAAAFLGVLSVTVLLMVDDELNWLVEPAEPGVCQHLLQSATHKRINPPNKLEWFKNDLMKLAKVSEAI